MARRNSFFIPAAWQNRYSFLLDGVNERITMGDVLNFDITEPFTYCAWIKTSTNARGIMSKANSASPFTGIWLYISSNKLQCYINGGTSSANNIQRISSTTITTGAWVHVAATYSGSKTPAGIKVFVNGVSETGTSSGTTLTGSSITAFPFQIGAVNSLYPFNGKIDEVMVFNAALTPTEITEIYNAGVPFNPGLFSNYAAMAAYYHIDNDVWNGSAYPVIDSKNGYDGLTVNMEETDKFLDVP